MKMFVFVWGRSIIYLKVAQVFSLFLCSSMYCCWKNTRLHTFLFVWPMCKIPYWNRGSTGHIVSGVLFRRVFITLFVEQVCQTRLDEFKSWRYTQLRWEKIIFLHQMSTWLIWLCRLRTLPALRLKDLFAQRSPQLWIALSRYSKRRVHWFIDYHRTNLCQEKINQASYPRYFLFESVLLFI